MPHRRRKAEEFPDWKREHNRSHKQVRARGEHTFARHVAESGPAARRRSLADPT